MITQKQLKEVLDYDSETGVFIWKKQLSRNVPVGVIAGSKTTGGYIAITIDGELYKAHRLAFLFMTGEFPMNQTDHVNGNKTDNRFCNLRNASHRTNGQNRIEHRRGCLVGASKKARRKTNPWRSQIKLHGKTTHLGYFPTEEEAHLAYQEALNGGL